MKLLITSDWHLDFYTAGLERHHDVAAAVEYTVEKAEAEKVDHYLFLGDLADPGVPAIAAVTWALWTAGKLARKGIESWWLAGNHDVIEDGRGTTTLSPLAAAGIEGVTVCEKPGHFSLQTAAIDLITLPYQARSSPTWEDPEHAVAKAREHGTARVCIVAGHLMLPGMHPGSESTDMPRGRDIHFPLAAAKVIPGVQLFNGHYHRQQVTPDGVQIPGSLARLTFGEEQNTPAFLIVELA
jgi:DNA repair exonuclease SbcCD nuclease subunit